jgi:hypothetical protein
MGLNYLELSYSEWRILEDIGEILEPFNDETVYLHADTYLTISVLGPLYNQMKQVTVVNDSDSTAMKEFKSAVAKDMAQLKVF